MISPLNGMLLHIIEENIKRKFMMKTEDFTMHMNINTTLKLEKKKTPKMSKLNLQKNIFFPSEYNLFLTFHLFSL